MNEENQEKFDAVKHNAEKHNAEKHNAEKHNAEKHNAEKHNAEKHNAVRLNKFIAGSGYTARRKADEFIITGRVTVNSKLVVSLGTKINPETDVVKVDGELIKAPSKRKENFVYVLLNKPSGYVTTTSDEKNRPTVLDLVGINRRIYPVGRLDYDTEGLLLLTNDGELANKLMHPKYGIYKTYLVKTNIPVDEKSLARLREGVKIKADRGHSTQPAASSSRQANSLMTNEARVSIVPKTDGKQLRISIHEGRNRQIRKMLEAVGCYVRKLKRVEYANLNITGLKTGGWRYLSAEEVMKLKELEKQI
jgi:pseudouridine synthase